MKPDLSSPFYISHVRSLCFSYQHWTGKQLIEGHEKIDNIAEVLFNAPFALVSHGTETIPVFNFGNNTALELFELDWDKFIQLPSQESADQDNQEDRKKLMARVNKNGYEENCKGIRISSTGKRFLIEGATVWNIINEQDQYFGQAAMFTWWKFL